MTGGYKGYIEVKIYDSDHTVYYKNHINLDDNKNIQKLIEDLEHYDIKLISKKWW